MQTIVRENAARFEGVLVTAMVKGPRELMIGAHPNPTFGPVVLVGDGGKYVEALGDVRVLLPRFEEGEVERQLRNSGSRRCSMACVTSCPLDVPAFCAAATKVGAP